MPHDAHPMGVLVNAMSALSVFHPDANPALRASKILCYSFYILFFLVQELLLKTSMHLSSFHDVMVVSLNKICKFALFGFFAVAFLRIFSLIFHL